MNAQIKEMLNAFEKGNFQKSYILALELSSSKFFDIKYKILSFSSFKLSKFKDTINYCEAYLKKTRDNDLQILKTLTSSYLNINNFEKTILYGEKIVMRLLDKSGFDFNLGPEDTKTLEGIRVALARLESNEDLFTKATEGIVFTHNNKTYKLTGLFTPINRLRGFFRSAILE